MSSRRKGHIDTRSATSRLTGRNKNSCTPWRLPPEVLVDVRVLPAMKLAEIFVKLNSEQVSWRIASVERSGCEDSFSPLVSERLSVVSKIDNISLLSI